MRSRIVLALCIFSAIFSVGAANAASQWTDLFEEIKARETVRIGIGYQTAPMNFLDDQGELAGFDVDLAKAITDKLGLKHELVKVNNKTRITALATGQVDMILSNINHTMSRDQQIDFSDTYLKDGKRVLAQAHRFTSLKDFVGKRIAVTQGSNAQQAVAVELRKLGDPAPKVISFQNEAECFLALKMNRVDGYTNDMVILAAMSEGDPGFEMVGENYSPTYYGIGLPENQSNWRDEINATLRGLYLNGTYQRIYTKWFGSGSKYPLPETSGQLDVWAD